MNVKLKLGIGLLSLLMFSCSQPEEKKELIKIGTVGWDVELPEKYVHFYEEPQEFEENSFCGIKRKGTVLLLFKVQQHDTMRVRPVPNQISATVLSKETMKQVSDSCMEDLAGMYRFFFGANETKFGQQKSRVKIGGVDFEQLENQIVDSLGAVSYGDVQLIGLVKDQYLKIQISYKDLEEKKRMYEAIRSSRFEL
ncbi:MAG: hypothetical protein EP338_11275 [Bacteroidetes bacterium]|nr:MAG: hypothetical protein EP338_11275 [Bacteroidota bacterium]